MLGQGIESRFEALLAASPPAAGALAGTPTFAVTLKRETEKNMEVVIVAATRTAIGSFGGALAKIPAPELGATVIKSLLAKTGLKPEDVSEVILGQVLTAGSGQNPARQALIKAGLPVTTPATTLNVVCGSGLRAVHLGAQAIASGDADIVIAGGQESMSLSPHILPGSRDGFRMGNAQLIDTMVNDGLTDAYNAYHMGITAENVAEKYGIGREEQDALALASQQRAAAAQKAGKFRTRSRQCWCRSARAIRWPSTATSSSSTTPAPKAWPSCAPPSEGRHRHRRQRFRHQ